MDEINSVDFVKARAEEMRAIEAALDTNRKKSLLFQRVPFHKRRRCRSRISRRRPRTPGLHAWHAKRFSMLRVFGAALPQTRFAKADSFVYKSAARGFVFCDADRRAAAFARSASGTARNAVVETEKYAIAVSQRSDAAPTGAVADLGAPIRVIGDVLAAGVYKIANGAIVACAATIDDFVDAAAQKSAEFSFAVAQATIFVAQRNLMPLWHALLAKGVVPVSIDELLRIGLESRSLVFPFDNVASADYAAYEDAVLRPVVEKYARTPLSKKAKTTSATARFSAVGDGEFLFFDVPKGRVTRCASVFANGEKVGAVVRAAFCYSAGMFRGICFVKKGNAHAALLVTNIESATPVRIAVLGPAESIK